MCCLKHLKLNHLFVSPPLEKSSSIYGLLDDETQHCKPVLGFIKRQESYFQAVLSYLFFGFDDSGILMIILN